MRLLAVETRRYFSRWAIRGGLALIAVFTLLVCVGFFLSTTPVTAAQIDTAEAELAAALEDWEEHGEEWIAECLEFEAQAREEFDDPDMIDHGCDHLEPRLEHYLPWQTTQEELESDMFGSGILLALPLVFALAVTFMAAEFSSETMSTWLTFEPRRQRVYFSKLISGSVISMVVIAIVSTILWAAARGIIRYWDLNVSPHDNFAWIEIGNSFEAALRFSLLGLFVGAVGIALATVVRHTAAGLGIAAGYLIAEGTASGIHGPLARFSILKHLEGVMMGGSSYYVEECAPQGGCQYNSVPIEFSTSVTVVIAVAVVFIALGAWQMQRRDVT